MFGEANMSSDERNLILYELDGGVDYVTMALQEQSSRFLASTRWLDNEE
jgi:hypothetical protein